MLRHRRRDPMSRYRRHQEEIIVLAVRWYISYRLSLRDLAEMLAERGLDVSVDDLAVGSAVRSGVRETLGPSAEARGLLVAHGRDLRPDSRPMVLPVSRSRQAGTHHRLG